MRLFSLRKFGYFLTILTSVLFGFIKVDSVRAVSTPFTYLTYSGRLVDDDGVPITSATIDMVFKLYSASSGGTCLWSNSSSSCATETERAVTLTEGLFSENLGEGTYAEMSSAIFGDDNSVYLEVVVEGETLSPRKLLTTVPYAVNSNMLRGYTPDSTVGAEEILLTNGLGKLAMIGATGIDASATNAVFRIDVSSNQADTDEDIVMAVTGDSASEVWFAVTRQAIIGQSDLLFLDSTEYATITSSDGLEFNAYQNNVIMALRDLNGTGKMIEILFGGGAVPFASGESVEGLSVDLSSGYTLHAAGNDLTGAHLLMGNGGAGTSTGLLIDGEPDYGIALADYGTAAINFVSAGTSFTSGIDVDIVMDPGDDGDFILYTTGGSQLAVDTAGIASGDSYLKVASSGGGATIGSALDAGVYLDFFTSTTVSNTSFYPLYIHADQGGGGAMYLNGCQAAISSACDDGADWLQDGLVFRDIHYDLVTGTDANGEGDFDLTILPRGEGGVIVDLNDTAGEVGAIVSNKKFRIYSDEHTDAGSEMFEVVRGLSGDFDGTVALFQNGATSAGSDATVVAIENFNSGGGNATGLVITQSTVNAADNVAPLSSAQALIIKVNEAASSDDVFAIYSDADGTPDIEFTFENDGDAFADGAFTGGGADLAEFFLAGDQALGPNEVVCQDEGVNAVRRCALGERGVVGVISTNPAFIGNNLGGAGIDLRNDPNYRLVGLVGQVATKVTAADGAIEVGDELTTSSFVVGAAGKAVGPGYIVGRALEPLASGSGVIQVLVQPMWWAGDMFTNEGDVFGVARDLRLGSAQASVGNSAVDSGTISFVGSVWGDDGVGEVKISQQLEVNEGGNYQLAWSGVDGSPLMQLQEDGDLLVTGRIFPGNRGVAQDEAYIYYDEAGGGYMRTNAAGWSVGSYDFAETYPADGVLQPGEAVEFSEVAGEVRLSSGVPYSNRLVGIVSTRPGFLAGDLTEGNYPIALSGRVPALVSLENGSVKVGDPLTTSATPGRLMKATEPGPVAGYALQNLESDGTLMMFVRPTYFNGADTDSRVMGGATNLDQLEVSGNLLMLGGKLQGIGQVIGLNGWSIAEDGTIVTGGDIRQVTLGHGGESVTTTVSGGPQRTVTLSGTTILQNGLAHIELNEVWPQYAQVVSPVDLPRVIVTPHQLVASLAVIDRQVTSFSIVSAGGESGVAVDWYLIAPHKDEASPWVSVEGAVSDDLDEGVVIEESAPEELAPEELLVEPGLGQFEGELETPTVPVVEGPIEQIVEESTEESTDL